MAIACCLMGMGAADGSDEAANSQVIPPHASTGLLQWMGACRLAMGDGLSGLVDPKKWVDMFYGDRIGKWEFWICNGLGGGELWLVD